MGHIKYYIFLLLFYSCKKEPSYKTLDKSIQNIWKADSLGCLNKRSLELAKELIIKNELIGKSELEFINIFGLPNKLIKQRDKVVYIYYIETRCKKGKIIENIDKCWIQINFEKGRLVSIPELFSCE